MKAHHQLGKGGQKIGRATPLAEAVKWKEDLEVERLKNREEMKKPFQLLDDEWFGLKQEDGYPRPSSAQHLRQRQPATARIAARIILQKKEPDRTAVSGLRRGTTETIAIAKFILGGNIYPRAYS